MREDRTAHVAAERDDEKIADPQGRSVVARRSEQVLPVRMCERRIKMSKDGRLNLCAPQTESHPYNMSVRGDGPLRPPPLGKWSVPGATVLSLIEEAQDLATGVLPFGLLVVHDAVGCRQDDVPELARRQEVVDPLLHLAGAYVKARRDDTALVDAPDKIDHDLAAAVVIDDLELTNVACARRRRPKGAVSPGRTVRMVSWSAAGRHRHHWKHPTEQRLCCPCRL